MLPFLAKLLLGMLMVALIFAALTAIGMPINNTYLRVLAVAFLLLAILSHLKGSDRGRGVFGGAVIHQFMTAMSFQSVEQPIWKQQLFAATMYAIFIAALVVIRLIANRRRKEEYIQSPS